MRKFAFLNSMLEGYDFFGCTVWKQNCEEFHSLWRSMIEVRIE
jgi:hypothetical protein